MNERIGNTKLWLWGISNPIRETNKFTGRAQNEQ